LHEGVEDWRWIGERIRVLSGECEIVVRKVEGVFVVSLQF
jgi:hypothetical protein